MTTQQDCRFGLRVLAVALVGVVTLPTSLAQDAPALPVAVDKSAEYQKEYQHEGIRRDQMEVQADGYVRAAQAAFAADEFQSAVDGYLEAIKQLEKCGKAPNLQDKVMRVKEAIAQVYHCWAEDLVRQAELDANAGEIEVAIGKCTEAIRMDPSSELRMKEAIGRFEKLKKVVDYRVETGERIIDPGKEDRLYRVDLLFAQGKKLYAEGQWDKARDRFEEILSLNPYNLKAIEYVRQINQKMFEAGKVRRTVTQEERYAEMEWKYVTPLLPRAESGLKEEEQAPVMKDDDGVINRKLREIVLDHIEFEEVTIPTVIKHLKQRSRELDPEGKGVNIFLRLQSGKSTEAVEQADELFGEEDAGFDAPVGLPGGPGVPDEADGEEAAFGDDGEGGGEAGAAPAFGGEIPTVTISVDNVPLGDVISYICKGANLKYRIEKYAVVIASQSESFEDMETKIYPLEQEAGAAMGGGEEGGGDEGGGSTTSMVSYFRQRGVPFPDKAKAVYDSRISRLIATNTPANLVKIEEVINELNVIDPQVLIECKFAEVQSNKLNNLGFEWRISRPVGPGTQSSTFDPNDPLMRFNSDATWTGNDRVFRIQHQDSQLVSWEAIIHALDLRDTTDILSTPRVTVTNGEEAVIRMATEVYYPESWGEAQFVSVPLWGDFFIPSRPEFGEPTELGVRMTVTPTVDADKYTISLNLVPIIQGLVGWLDYSYTLNVNGVAIDNTMIMPIIEARRLETQFSVYDGETVVLGGVIRDNNSTIDDRVPVLGDLPLLGRFFRSKVDDASKANLLIFTTVRLVNPDGSPLREREVRGKPPFRN